MLSDRGVNPINLPILLILLLLLSTALSPSVHAQVTVRFEQPEKYTDFELSTGSTPKAKADLMKQFEKYFQALGAQYLPKGDTLEIVILDIDMAGAFEGWRRPNLMWTRIISDVYPPKFVLHYVWRDKTGRIKADREETVTDLDYLRFRDQTTLDPLRYDKALLSRWFRRTFGETREQSPLDR